MGRRSHSIFWMLPIYLRHRPDICTRRCIRSRIRITTAKIGRGNTRAKTRISSSRCSAKSKVNAMRACRWTGEDARPSTIPSPHRRFSCQMFLGCPNGKGIRQLVSSLLVTATKKIAVLPGDGIGREVIPQAMKVMMASGAPIETTEFDWGAARYLADGVTVPADGFSLLGREFDAILVGAFGDPRVPTNIHAKEILLGMRFRMDLYANVRPVQLLDAELCPLKDVGPGDIDFVVIRENTEGVYGDLGGVFKQGTPDEIATQEDVNTRKGVERIVRYAFDYCERHAKQDGSPRRRVLMCDKSNAMTHAGSLWQRTFKEVAREYPQITPEHMYVDALCMQMVRDPRQFDGILT